jgi:Tc toxin complex TcA C-terminal TcB-binding domain/Neuraminidase-like domain
MQNIIAPLNPQMQSDAVANLQDALLFLVERSLNGITPDAFRPSTTSPTSEELKGLLVKLRPERAKKQFGSATQKLVLLFQIQNSLGNNLEGVVEEKTAKSLNEFLSQLGGLEPTEELFIVRGTIHQADNSPLVGVLVEAFDIDLRNEQKLGEIQTDRQGFYQIQYSPRQFRKQEKGHADLIVKTSNAVGQILVTSPIWFNAPAIAEINLTIPADIQQPLSLFEKITDSLAPILGELSIVELEESPEHQDLTFLAGETGLEKPLLARFAIAHQLAAQAIQPQFWFAILGGSFYQYVDNQSLALQLIPLLDSLSSLDATAIRKSLVRSFNQTEIPPALPENVDNWVEEFLQFIASHAVRSSDRPTFLKQAIGDAGIQSTEKQIKFARLFNQYKAFTPEVLTALEADPAFTKPEIDNLHTSFQLSNLTQSDFSVVKAIKEEFDIRQPAEIRALAKRSESEWVNLATRKYAAGDITLPVEVNAIAEQIQLPQAEIFGKTLDRQFSQAFPTTAFTGGLDRALQNGGSPGLSQAPALSSFLNGHEDFEFLNTPIDDFFQNHVRPDFQELAQNDDLRLEMKAVQRVFKLAPNFAATNSLLADDLHSAQKVYRMGETEFVRQYGDRPGFTTATAKLAWNRAADTHAAALTIVTDLQALAPETLPKALRNNDTNLSTFPNWNNLFQTGDLCECEHCRSVLSPAAYFADLLMFLKERKSANAPPSPGAKIPSVNDVLFARRPDLGFLELNCDNALVPLPYTDVVCEVLERAIDATGENDLELAGFTTIPTNSTAAKTAVANAFTAALVDLFNADKQNIALSETFSISQIEPTIPNPDPNRWVVHSDNVTYLLHKKLGETNFSARILPNTKAPAAELRAYPQYVNPKTYNKLKAASYPISLPFDLFAEEVRAGFQKTNLQRWDLMRTFRGSATPNNPTDSDIATEYFGISSSANPADPSEKNLILVAAPTIAAQQTIWGESSATWLDNVANVKIFLQKTQLEYNELLVLLDLKFINPSSDISIQPIDPDNPSCDTDKNVIRTLDETKLDRIHRFLRLWRKLNGWKMWELDLVIRHPNIGNELLNEQFLIDLFYFSRLKTRLGKKASVEQLCALFGTLNVETHFTKLHEKRQNSLYHNLFLNKQLSQPLDLAFEVTKVDVASPTVEKISTHQPVILAALGIKEADLLLLKGLTKIDGSVYITKNLTLKNLSFLWRHAWLAKLLKLTIEDWQLVLKIFHENILQFANPQAAWKFIEKVDRLKATGFKPDEVNCLLAGDPSAKSATKETEARRFLTSLRQALASIKTELAIIIPTDENGLVSLLTSLLQKLDRNETEANAFIEIVKKGVNVSATSAEFVVKFYEPQFSTSLINLPTTIDFATQLPSELAVKIAYNSEQRLLQFTGIMSNAEQTALLALSDNPAYVVAINGLESQPQTMLPPDERIWLTDADLDATQPANDNYIKRLTNAVSKSLGYLSKKLTENAIVQQSSTQLGLTAALTRRLLTDYPILPSSLLTHLSGNFALDTTTLHGWYWINRVATILNKWQISFVELEKIVALTPNAQLLDFLTLPLDDSGAISSIDRFLRTSQLLHLRNSLPETQITLLEVLEKLNSGAAYTKNKFAADVELLNEAWLKTDVKTLTDSLNLNYPDDYLLAENWERLQQAFRFMDNLNASANTVKTFAAAAMTIVQAITLKELLRSKFGAETWLKLSAEIQDLLRDRKRSALTAYLLSQPQPTDAPSGKWENTNDLYAYYLLDVEMGSCQLTSRLVQASGSIQLFVQRCLMGLEPDVVIKADGDDGDSAWRWWQWMRKYRVWEANRKVFLWPENWIEPELKKDKSSFFRDLENELLQNEINQDNVEKAFTNYLEKLDGVAQLEIAGFYQEDDGDNAIVHVFGRTQGAEPHIYYYRRYDYRQWTPWEKVDLDIQGEYLVPAVVNKRLFLFWPVFTEVPDEDRNHEPVPLPPNGATEAAIKPAYKKLRLQMAVSDYRQGKWTPKRVSKDFQESATYSVEIIRKHYRFFPIDRSEIEGRVGIKYEGYSLGSNGNLNEAGLFGAFEISGCKGVPERTFLPGFFKHAIRPERNATGNDTAFLKWVELDKHDRLAYPENDFTLENNFADQFNDFRFISILLHTPGIFQMTPPWHLSYFDKLLLDGLVGSGLDNNDSFSVSVGSWLPFFYNDKKRTFFILPALESSDSQEKSAGNLRSYYPGIKKFFRKFEDDFEGQVLTWLESIDLAILTPIQRQQLEQSLHQRFLEDTSPPGNTPPSYTDKQVKSLIKRSFMRFFHYYLGRLSSQLFQSQQFHFKNYYHPFVCDFAKLVYNPLKGIPALMSRETQLKNSEFSFRQTYQPTNRVVELPTEAFYPQEVVDFTPDGAYSSYNWELFFHTPLLIANSLSKNQRFEEARNWYHFIFNPIGVESTTQGGSPMSKYWITKPFFETTDLTYVQQRIDHILRMLAGNPTVPGYSAQAKKDLEDQVLDWRTNPFEPHRIANYRTVAYQKTVVMKYLDNLIEWGDNLFRQDSMESINEATQLYILAAEILGTRPRKIPPQAKPPLESFNELETQFDKFSNALVQVENLVPSLPGNGQNGGEAAPLPRLLYFCIPQNEKMLGYWDTVADRLYKIRNCMNIEGVVRQLALFEPPIDPGALVKAVAAGIDITSALTDLNAPLPLYRFNVLLQKANEVCNDVKVLGSALLSALEKKDAETMGLLRQSQEILLLEAVKALREQQILEAKENLEGVKKSLELADLKQKYYQSREFMNVGESIAMILSGESTIIDAAAALGHLLAAGTRTVIPQFTAGGAGFGGSPVATATFGGETIGDATESAMANLSTLSRIMEKVASITSTIASYQRRQDDWDFQKDLAVKEIEQIDKSIAAAELRVSIAEKELENHIIQIQNAKATDEFMRSKYTNQELYQWHVGQLSGLYFQSYRLAYDLAKRAERCFRFEIGLQDSSYINFGYWDSLKKGLLSGEKLQYDLRRLENAYLEQYRREFELTKHISLTLLDPLALLKLRETGQCFINLPEEIFDLDYPGHYFRRIKSVSLTLPCVVGPYTTVSCTLRLLNNSIRINTANGDNGYAHNVDNNDVPADDDRFIENNIPVKSIASSNAQNDSGIFELSFRDERYLPFEGAGAISRWSLELFNDRSSFDFGKTLRQFDYETISDAILHVKYTAREDVGTFKNGAIANLKTKIGVAGSVRLFSIRHEFPTEWAKFKNMQIGAALRVAELTLTLQEEHYPFWSKDNLEVIRQANLFVNTTETITISYQADGGGVRDTLIQDGDFGNLQAGILTNLPNSTKPISTATEKFTLYFTDNSMEDIWLAIAWDQED